MTVSVNKVRELTNGLALCLQRSEPTFTWSSHMQPPKGSPFWTSLLLYPLVCITYPPNYKISAPMAWPFQRFSVTSTTHLLMNSTCWVWRLWTFDCLPSLKWVCRSPLPNMASMEKAKVGTPIKKWIGIWMDVGGKLMKRVLHMVTWIHPVGSISRSEGTVRNAECW